MATTAPIPLTNVGRGYTIVTQVIPSSTDHQNSNQTLSPLRLFLKGEPKALGTVQIMNGLWMMLIGVFDIYRFTFWVSLIHVLAGSLTILAGKKIRPCEVKAALVLNILSALAAVIGVISDFLSGAWIIFRYSRWSYEGSMAVFLVFSLLQFAVCISIAVFACKATCSKQPAMPMGPYPQAGFPADSSFPVYPNFSPVNTFTMSSSPGESPPAYSESRDVSEN